MPDWISFHASFRLTVKASILPAISHLRNIFNALSRFQLGTSTRIGEALANHGRRDDTSDAVQFPAQPGIYDHALLARWLWRTPHTVRNPGKTRNHWHIAESTAAIILETGLPLIRARSLVFLSSNPNVLPPLRPRGLDTIQQNLVAT